jgi:hypothetical protein
MPAAEPKIVGLLACLAASVAAEGQAFQADEFSAHSEVPSNDDLLRNAAF